jgi:type VI secretion system protein ImpA
MTDPSEEAGLLEPVSPEAPCGPDLDAEGDSEFLNFMAAMDGLFPSLYFDFKPSAVDFAGAFATGARLLARSHDLRLVVVLAKLSILNGDVHGLARWLAVSARLLADHWEDVHPRGEEGDFLARVAQLSTLEDSAVVVLPLQYAPLAGTQRDGTLNFRAQLVALGEVRARESKELPDGSTREGDKLPNASVIEKILLNADLPLLVNALRSLRLIQTSIGQIRTILTERLGGENALNFDVLAPLVGRIGDFLHAAIARRDPSVAAPASSPEAQADSSPVAEATPPPQFASLADVDAALGAALGYFETQEPSNAAVLLIGQARQLLGKNIYDVMKLLAPNHVDNARIFVGGDTAFTVPVSAMVAGDSAPLERREAPPAASRAAALALIDSVAAHLRKAEPSSPGPFLLDRAKVLATRDFLTLLKDILPEDSLSSMKNGR